MKIRILRSLSSCLLILAVSASLLRADRAADLSNERMVIKPPLHKYTGVVPASGGPTGYTPQQLRHAYGFDQLNTTGQGQVIAIVDAYGSPTIQSDLDTFCQAMGIPSTTVQVYYPQGQPATNSDWATETSLDVEWAHAIAPGATIVLIATQDNSDANLYAGVDFAASTGATQVSMSWGEPEFSGETTFDNHFNVPGVTFFASSGDSGAGVIYPASSPYVVAVGGTTLGLDSLGNITSETAWSGSGGGPSAYEATQSFQAGWWDGPGRGVPDVAYDADPATGVPVYLTGPGWGQWGGTSMAAPQWAALCALANSLRQQSIDSAPGLFYSLATANYAAYYHDIISGSNGAYSAGPGYDLVTGLGSPIANLLVTTLAGGSSTQAAAPVFSPPVGTYPNTQSLTVTIRCATPNVSIRFTLDGSTPTETYGTIYSAPISITANTTLTAIAYKSGLTDSPVTSGNYAFLPPVAAPTFSPPAGNYRGAQTVTISTTTSGAQIRYTTDGSLPSETKGMLYSAPVNITANTELNAIAYETGFIDSPVTNGFYSITLVKVLYTFTGSTSEPSGLTLGSDGNFYGTTISGGSNNGGIVFKVTPAGVVTTVASFPVVNGQTPLPNGVMQASDGNFYGTTDSGGSSGSDGSVFKLTPAGVFTTLVSFTGTNGNNPHAGLMQASDGNFYGTTVNGGSYGFGNVFKVTPAGVLTSLVSFDGTTNGETPAGALIQASDGNFYSTTANIDGGPTGTVFKMTPTGGLTTLVVFNGGNGAQPAAALVQGTDGNFYGTSEGVTNGDGPNVGTVFKMTPAGSLTTLVAFDETNGAVPAAPLIQASDGNFYGTASWGGVFDIGIVFRITPAGAYTILASFTGADGDHPTSGLVQGRDGNFYGTANDGPTGNGVIYQLLQAAAPAFSPAAGTYTSAQTVKITSATSGATIVYTTDGTAPTQTNGTIYSGPVTIGTSTTLRAMAYESGYIDSGITSGTYTMSVTVSSSNGFYNTPMSSSQSGTFTATFDASTSLAPSNVVIALSKGAQTAYAGLACIARFNTAGDIDAYNGTGYQAASVIPYAKNTTYHFRMVVNVPANTYSVYVTPPGGSELTVGLNYKFRTAVTSLDTWTIDVNATPGGSVTVSNRFIIGSQQVAAPTFTPPAGTYTSAQSVTITSVTGGASIAYTTDGSTPTESGGMVTHGTVLPNGGSVSVSITTTLKALAFKGGMLDSTVTTGLYTISLPQVVAPTFSPPAGTYTSAQSVTITSVTGGASIAYTTDGTTPTESGGTITHGAALGNGGSVFISSTTTLKAIAYEAGMTDSTVTSGVYTISLPQVAAPIFTPPAGTYTSPIWVTISTTTSGASIAYTTDGTTPTESGGSVTHGTALANGGSVYISVTTTLKVLAFKSSMTDSTVVTGLYTINLPQVGPPMFSPLAGTYTSAQMVTITSTTGGASIAYTTDGSTPTESGGTVTHGTLLSNGGSVTISVTCTLKAMAFKSGMTDSTVSSGSYTIGTPQVAAPTFNPPAGTYTSAQTVTITSTTSGATIVYTTDGSTPTESGGTVTHGTALANGGSVSIGTTTTLKAIAYEAGMTDSTVTTGVYTINVTTRSLTGSSSDGWHNLPIVPPQTGTFTATFDATPTVSPENAVVGLSKGVATAYTGLSCIARFNTSGDIDAYNGTGYQAASVIPYAKNIAYHFRLVVNVPAHTYSVYVTPAGGSELTVGLNYAFRSTAVVSSLDTWDLDVNATPSGCSLTANNLNP